MNIQAGKPVTGDQLIGRSAEISLINKLLDQGQSVVLVAPRRFGKTSVLKQVMNQRKERGEYTAFIDLFSIPDRIGLSAELTKSVLGNKKIQQEKAVVLAIAGSSKVQLYHELDYRKINVSRTLKKLIGNGMIEKSDKGIYLTDPLLTWWIRENILKINQ